MYRIANELIRVADLLLAFEFPTDDALKEYLKLHPKADPKKHWVKEQKDKYDKEIPQEQEGKKVKLNEHEEERKIIEGTPFWKKKEENLVKKISGKAQSYEMARGEHVNTAYFETHDDGTQSVWKPDKGSYDLSDLRYDLRPEISQGQREGAAYQLDKVLGLGIVPPTVYVKKTNVPTGEDASGTSKGSSQLFVKGKAAYKIDEVFDNIYEAASPELHFQIEKIALFDVITGNTDRHTGNIFISPDKKNAYAIDNGLILPNKENSNQFRSAPYTSLKIHADDRSRPFSKRLIKHLTTIDKDAFMKAMKDSRLEHEGKFAWLRLESILKDYGMKHEGPHKEEKIEKEPVKEPKKKEEQKNLKLENIHEDFKKNFAEKDITPQEKDFKRISDIYRKAKNIAGNDYDKLYDETKRFVERMAHSITDPAKAYRRGKAVEEMGWKGEVADIFYSRAQELVEGKAKAKPEPKEVKPKTEPKPKEEPKEVKPKTEPKPKEEPKPEEKPEPKEEKEHRPDEQLLLPFKTENKEEPIKEDYKPKPEVLQNLKKSLGERGEKLNNTQLLILFKTLAKRGWFDKGKAEKTMEAIGELVGKV